MASGVLVENRAGLAAEAFDALSRVLAPQDSLRRALDWLLGQRPPLAPEEMLTQDEYSHDLLVPYPGGLYLVYDST